MRRAARWALPGLALAAAWCLFTTVGPTSDTSVSDLYLYATYADLVRSGLTPFSGFPFEYPPLAILPMIAARWFGPPLSDGYAIAFGAQMLVAALALQAAVGAIAGRRAAWLMVPMPLLLGALVRTHLDLLPAAMAVGGVALLLRDRPTAAFALLGLGTATKLVPGLIALVACAWLLGRGERRAAARGVLAFAAVVLVVFLPFAGTGLVDSVRFHLDRPVQIESTPAAVLRVVGGSYITGTAAHPDDFKSNGLAGGRADAVSTAFTLVLALVLAGIVLLATRRRTAHDLVLLAFAALIAFVALGKVLSPQYLVWLYPFAVLGLCWPVDGTGAGDDVRRIDGSRIAGALVLLAGLLGQLWFPRRYGELVTGDGSLAALVGVRDGLLLVALAVLIATVAAPARSTSPRALARSE